MGLFDSLFGSDEPSETTREPAFDDLYYPSAADELETAVQTHLNAGRARLEEGAPDGDDGALKGVLVPHAEYTFAGELMGLAWAMVEQRSDAIERIVVVGSSERVPFQGVATSRHSAFRTPLGAVGVDLEVVDSLLETGTQASVAGVRAIDVAFDPDPSIEVQLPFAQTVCGGITLVPLLVGDGQPEAMAGTIDRALVDDATALIVAANLSQGLAADEAADKDRDTADAIETLNSDRIDRDASAARMAIKSTLHVCEGRGWTARCHRLASSGGKGGEIADRVDKVTGYGVFSFRDSAEV